MTDASAIVRVKDEAGPIRHALDSLRRQTVPVEIVVVDSGSTDGTLEVARAVADRLVEISPERFTYGHALNVGAAAASGRVHIALSAHCTARSAALWTPTRRRPWPADSSPFSIICWMRSGSSSSRIALAM